MLGAFKNWINTNPTGLGPNDHVALLTTVPLLDGSGNPTVAGIAYLSSTCSTYKVSLTSDPGAIWQHVVTVAHEMAHK
jgi:hypothetical protein